MLNPIFYLEVAVAMFKYDIEMASYSGTSSSTTRKHRRTRHFFQFKKAEYTRSTSKAECFPQSDCSLPRLLL